MDFFSRLFEEKTLSRTTKTMMTLKMMMTFLIAYGRWMDLIPNEAIFD